MAAALAEGKTLLENAALEPEIDDLIAFLNEMGAKIRRRSFRKIEIEGVDKLTGAIHRVMPDRNEAVSYACAAIITRGDIVVENARHRDLTAFLENLMKWELVMKLVTMVSAFFTKELSKRRILKPTFILGL
jgi:UDP-N-acetylglucosamine 1-carboxyvinyltransferase